MTVTQMIKKYTEISKSSEYISIAEVINDLWQIKREQQAQRIPKKDR